MVIHSKNMLFIRFARTAILATAAVGRAGALMAQSEPSADNATPSPVAAKAPTPKDPITGMPLPLHPWEKVIPFGDGRCGIVDDEFAAPIKAKWQGSCRFGLAHGRGMASMQGEKGITYNMHYGFRPNQARGNIPNMKHTYFDDMTSIPNYRRVGVYAGEGLDLAVLNSKMGFVVFDRFSDVTTTRLTFFTREFSCPFTKFDEKYEPSRDDLRAISRVCSLAASPADGGLAFFRGISDFDRVRGTEVLKGAVRQEVWICRKVSKAAKPDCSEAIQTAIAPYLTEINEVILADKDAVERARAEITKRFEPLEIAARPKRLELARRIAASYVPRSAPAIKPAAPASSAVGTKRPTEMGKGK